MSILDEYADRSSLAHDMRCSERSIARYENLPDGLPSLMLGGRKLYHIPTVREWISRRMNRPNPRRAA